MGPAISRGWGYKLVRKEKLDDYEKTRPAIRNEKELRLSRQVREAIIKNLHFTRKEIRTAYTSKARARFRRSRALENSTLARYEEKLESITRKMKRIILRQEKDAELKKLWPGYEFYSSKNKLDDMTISSLTLSTLSTYSSARFITPRELLKICYRKTLLKSNSERTLEEASDG